ncbi:antioxidant, AhpC/TSA family [Bacteroides pyogenes F0041]|uniref:Antioxidant, AhpC/TSA family n=1 Tax=Bacteroides pyogenes F0041 TaxID=1321819 RepID=U2CPN2_9BACE|nr:TlpA disulfide reductase family protein [Bacteroides pyogenes]ERI86505.1 antioxidant, AhpC/TSA family [Bacteroides pyogenes F0041]
MKKNDILTLMLTLLCLTGCNKNTDKVVITGEIGGMATDTLYMYGADEGYDRIDTLFVDEKGKFSHTVRIDTLTSVYLLIGNRVEYPLYLDKGDKISIKGDTARLDLLEVSGNADNEALTAFMKETADDTKAVKRKKAEEFIKNHRHMLAGIYLLDRFLVDADSIDIEKVKGLMETMPGKLQDTRYVEWLKEKIAQAEKVQVDRYVPYFDLPNTKGKRINRLSEDFREKYLLVNFWASWADSLSNEYRNRELRQLYRKYKKNKYIGMLGVSLDVAPETWKAAVKKDSLEWEQVCDEGGLNSEAIAPYVVDGLPANVLISPEGRVVAKNIWGDALREKLEESAAELEKRKKK